MALALKRKRGAVEVLDTPKRTKSTKSDVTNPTSILGEKAGWDAAFKTQQLVETNDDAEVDDGVSSEVLDFDNMFGDEVSVGLEAEKRGADLEAARKSLRKAIKRREAQGWTLSTPIGGRMINVDPVFTPGEEFLILANRATINVYSTSNSLLHRSIKLKDLEPYDARIVAYHLSPTDDSTLWVASSNGLVFNVNWMDGSGTDQNWGISSTGCVHMTAASMETGGRRGDIVFTTEATKDGGWRITANELALPGEPHKMGVKTIYTTKERVNRLIAAEDGSVLAASSGNKILIGCLKNPDFAAVNKIKYEWRIFESSDYISSFDLQVLERTDKEHRKLVKKLPVVNLVVGDVKGFIFSHTDLLAKLVLSQDSSLPSGWSLTPKKLHWHRQDVLCAKWSRDGNYIISGGSETVLVLWQLETGKTQFLPHLTATVQNVVVSPSGSSYAIQLADNSAMVISTAELEPTANIAGIQANVTQVDIRSESHVRRVEEDPWGKLVYQKTPAVMNPSDPSRLLLAVGQTQEMRRKNPLILSNPFLQTFDLGNGVSLSKQPLTRANTTNVNIAPNAHRLSEPRVTHMKMSSDGTWLVTVDEWSPPKRDLDFLGKNGGGAKIAQQNRREVFLKFWQCSAEDNSWELISRIDSPHANLNTSSGAGRVLDLAVDPSSLRFATIGEDNMVRTWVPKTRKRDGVIVRSESGVAAKNWVCEQAVPLGKPELSEEPQVQATGGVAFSEDGSVLAAAIENPEGLLHLLDPELGIVRRIRTGMFESALLGLEFLAQDLITLSNKLNVFDLVAEEMKSSIKLSQEATALDTDQKKEMYHLAVDPKAKTYAIAIPRFVHKPEAKFQYLYTHTELAVFSQEFGARILREPFTHLVTALLPQPSSEGYLVLDTSAEITTVMKRGTQSVLNMAQSTTAQQLDNIPEETTGDLSRLVEEADEETDYQPPTPALTQDDADDDNETPVVSQQKLSEIFDIGPSYALPPLEEMFYQVAGLFSSKPLVHRNR